MMAFGDSQWGDAYRFKYGDTTITVMTHLHVSGPYLQIKEDGSTDWSNRYPIVDGIYITNIVGDEVTAKRMLAELERRFVGKPLAELRALAIPATPLELPDAQLSSEQS